ncbi:MAG: hypothetical protein ACJAVF_002477, partial [Paraglaciecola sp.]
LSLGFENCINVDTFMLLKYKMRTKYPRLPVWGKNDDLFISHSSR